MAWPITTATKVHLDASTDDPSQARAELAALVDKVNEIINQMATIAAINKIAVWDDTGKLNGDITGNAETAKNSLGTGSIPLARSENGLRLLRVSIDQAGSITRGSGLTCSRTATGDYTLTFTNAFSAAPTIVAGCGPSGIVFVRPYTITTSSARVLVYNSATTLFSADFEVIIIGPN